MLINAIDAHVHLWTNDRQRYPRTSSERHYSPERFTAEDFFSHAKHAGVTRAVLVQMSFYKFDNSYMVDSMRAHPGVFSGIGIVDSLAERPDRVMRELAKEGVRGFRIVPGDSPADTSGMDTMWQYGGEQHLAMCALAGPRALPWIGRMCSRYPDTPVVIDHLARIGADGEIRDSDTRLLCGLAKHKNLMVKLSAFYALGRKQAPYLDLAPLIRRVFEDFGPRRLMWASDSPFQVQEGHNYASSIALIRDRLPFLTDEDRQWLLAKAAQSFFFGA